MLFVTRLKPRHAEQFNGREGETATFLSRCPSNFSLRVGGFAPRHLSRSAASCFYRRLNHRRKKMKRLFVITAFIFISAVSVTFAQTNDECGCSGLLAGGVFNKYRNDQSESAERDMLQFIAFSSYDEFRQAASAGGSGDYFGSYGKFGFDANWNKEQFEKHQRALTSQYQLSENKEIRKKLLQDYASDVIVNGFNECRRTCNPRGVKIYSRINDKKNVTLTIQFTPYPGQNTPPTVTDSRIEGGKVTIGNPPELKVFAPNTQLNVGENKVTVERIENQPIQVLIKAPGMDVEEYIPEYRESLKPNPNVLLLFEGTNTGDIQKVQTALSNRASVNSVDNKGLTPLLIASDKGSLEMVKLLLDKGAFVNYQDIIGVSALYAAAINCNQQIVTSLIEKGANVNIQITSQVYQNGIYHRWTPLDAALEAFKKDSRCEAVVNTLRARGGFANKH